MADRATEIVEGQRSTLIKAFATTVGSDALAPPSRKEEPDTREQVFNKSGAIEPPYDPQTLARLYEVSNSLRQNVESYEVNIDGFGHRFEAAIELDKDDAAERVRDALLLEALHEKGTDDPSEYDKLMPSEQAIADKLAKLKIVSSVERAKLKSFFEFAAQDMSFPKLRMMTRMDLEVHGNGYWEVLRNKSGKVARFVYVPGWTVRLRPMFKKAVEIEERIPISQVTFGKVSVKKRFRSFVQIADGEQEAVYFKAFGDPRTVSRQTGKLYDSPESMKAAEPESTPANEMIHFQIASPLSPYGVPRWIGNLLSVLGSRSAEEVNYFYFENKAVPPLAVLVSGGRLSKSSVPKIEDFIENNIKGRRNFHKILILEAVTPQAKGADTGPHPQRPMIEIKPLKTAQNDDALFSQYDQANIDKVGSSFRVPRLLRGDSKDFNRATAEAAVRMAEEQVFQPHRDDFDFFINHLIMPELGARFWTFKSNSRLARDPETMGKILEGLTKQGVLTPEEARVLAGDIFNRDFAIINEPWVKQPVPFTLAGIQTGQAAPVGAEKGDIGSGDLSSGGALVPAQGNPPRIPSISSNAPGDLAQLLLRIRQSFAEHQTKLERDGLADERGVDPDKVIRIEVTRDQMDELVEAHDDDDETATGG